MEIENKIKIILGQTDYTENVAKEKLIEHNNDEILVIKEYCGINNENKNNIKIKSINQEIYRQLRIRLNTISNDFSIRK
jgi:hypothetical protein